MNNKSGDDELDIKIDQILLNSRRLFLYKEIDEVSAEKLNKQLIALDMLEKDRISEEKDETKKVIRPIILEINSPGGCCSAGFSIINTMNELHSKVITIINGTAASMAGLISIAGYTRLMYPNSWWMAHDMASGIIDYSKKMEARNDFLKKLWNSLYLHLKKYTKLSEKEIDEARNGELWLNCKECYSKKIVDAYFDVNNKIIGKENISKKK